MEPSSEMTGRDIAGVPGEEREEVGVYRLIVSVSKRKKEEVLYGAPERGYELRRLVVTRMKYLTYSSATG